LYGADSVHSSTDVVTGSSAVVEGHCTECSIPAVL